MAFKMKYKNLQGVVDELRSAVKAHGKQADTIEKHIDKMEDSPMKKTTGSKAKGIDGVACWKGFGIPKDGPKTKMKGGERVDNCKPL
jgi:hypothetical protein